MKIKEIHIKNFRSILNETLTFDALTILVGRNGSGKSSFLKAIELFYETSHKIGKEDFYSENTDEPIEITVTYKDLSTQAQNQFSKYIENGELKVSLVISMVSNKIDPKYHGMRWQNSDFETVRNAGSKTNILKEYKAIKSKQEYENLPTCNSADEVEKVLTAWENENPKALYFGRDVGNFFGFKEVGQGLSLIHI